MKDYLFMSKVLPKLDDGELFRNIFSYIIKVLAVLTAIFGLVMWITNWVFIFNLRVEGIIGGLFFQILFIIAFYIIIHILWIRSGDVKNQEAGSYTVIPIISVITRMLGEVFASFISVLSVAGGIFIMFAGRQAYEILQLLSIVPNVGASAGSFFSGIMFLISGIIVGIILLIVHYLIAELIAVLVDMAKNLRAIRKSTAGGNSTD